MFVSCTTDTIDKSCSQTPELMAHHDTDENAPDAHQAMTNSKQRVLHTFNAAWCKPYACTWGVMYLTHLQQPVLRVLQKQGHIFSVLVSLCLANILPPGLTVQHITSILLRWGDRWPARVSGQTCMPHMLLNWRADGCCTAYLPPRARGSTDLAISTVPLR